jgi:hypothetical protein
MAHARVVTNLALEPRSHVRLWRVHREGVEVVVVNLALRAWDR